MAARYFGSALAAAALIVGLAGPAPGGVLAAEFATSLTWSGQRELRAGVSGVVEMPALVPGSTVAAGEVVVGISPAFYEASLLAATRAAELARDELELAEQAFERNETLFEDGSMSLVEFDVAKLDLDRARSSAAAAEAELVSARSKASRSRVRLPGPIVVLDVAVADGDFVEASLSPPTLVTVARADEFEARIDVDPNTRAGLSLGDVVTVRIGEGTVDGRVAWLRGLVVDGTARHWIGVTLGAGTGNFVAGTPVVVEIP